MERNQNTDRYTGRGSAYAARAAYPESLVFETLEATGLRKADMVADIGSGNGRFAEMLLKYGLEVYAVEPSDMSVQAQSRLGTNSLFHSIKGEAVKPNLPESINGKISAVCVGQAVHWWRDQFKEAVGAWHQFLRPGAKVVLLTLHWNDADPVCIEINDTLIRVCPNYMTPPVRLLRADSPGFAPGEHTRYIQPGTGGTKRIEEIKLINEEAFRAQMISFSFTPQPDKDPENHARVLDSVLKIFHKRASDGVLKIPIVIETYYGSLVDSALIQ